MCLSVSLANRLGFWVERSPRLRFLSCELIVTSEERLDVAAKEQKACVIGCQQVCMGVES
jgi:hypothetical protein